MAASAHLLLPALSKRPAEPSAEPDVCEGFAPENVTGERLEPWPTCLSGWGSGGNPPEECSSAEGACAEPPLTSEPPLPDAEPLTSEPPLADVAHLISEPTSTGAASGV